MGRNPQFTKEDLFHATKTLILEVGYEGFTISKLADDLSVSRAAVYKHYTNKNELLMDFMIQKMKESTEHIKQIDRTNNASEQLLDLLERIYDFSDLHQILGLQQMIPNESDQIIQKKQHLSSMHKDLYSPLVDVIITGKKQNFITQRFSNEFILSMIFQMIDVPKSPNLSTEQFIQQVYDFLLNGIK